MKCIISCLTAIFISTGLMAQSYGELRGKVYDETGEPMPFVNVYVKVGETPIGSQTDYDGEFIIKPLKTGTYNVHFSYIGYHEHIITGTSINPDQINSVQDVALKLNSTVIEGGAVIEADAVQLIDPEQTSKMTIRFDQIENTPVAKSPVKMIASLSSEISKDPNSDELYFRGSRAGTVLVIIDGVKILRGLSRVPGSAISSVSVYTGGLPAKYGDVTGGVVVMETKTYFDFYNQKIAELSMR